jgi:DNA polymerase-1
VSRVEDALAKHKLSAPMLLQVHDELVFGVPDGEVAKMLLMVVEHAPLPALSLSVSPHESRRQLGRGALGAACPSLRVKRCPR